MLVGYFLAKNVLPYAIIQPPRLNESWVPEDFDLVYQRLEIATTDSIQLKGYHIKAHVAPAKAVILFVHGIGGCKEHFLPLSQAMALEGYESLLIDSRAHGESGGDYTSYGYKEKKDLAHLVDYMKQYNDTIPIGIWGNSMGGAIALQAMEYDKRIEFGIIESTFTSLREIVYDYQAGYTYGLRMPWLCDIALDKAGVIGDFIPDEVSPLRAVQNIEQAVFIAHGQKDENIDFSYGQRLFENLATPHKKFVPVKEGGHFNLSEKGGSTYKQELIQFLNTQTQQ